MRSLLRGEVWHTVIGAGAELVTVAVCSVGDAQDSLAACLEALSAAGVARPVVLRGSGPMSLLRNEALAGCRTPVIAFVDDDVEVSADWLEVLNAEWSAAAADVGCIGGPVVPENHPESPAWLSGAVAAGATANTPAGHEASGGRAPQTYCGGNASFRASALAGVGGFWPVAGAGRLRDWLSEEHHAQRELARVGWKAKLVPGLSARRVVRPSAGALAMARGQAVAGARRRAIGGASRAEVGPAVRAASGALVAAATLNRSRAVERLVRAAGHAGTAFPGALASKTLAPAASSTPFRHSVPPPPGTRKGPGPRRAGPQVHCFHRVTDAVVPSGLAVGTARFREILEGLLARGAAVPASEQGGRGKPFSITFDDGYADNLHVALPILEEYEVPATFFITTDNVAEGRSFWWDVVARSLEGAESGLANRGVLELTCAGETRSWAPVGPGGLAETHRHLVAWLQSQPPEAIEETLAELQDWAGPPKDLETDRPLDPGELADLAVHPLVTIGAHTQTHANLRFCEPDRLESELTGARTQLAGLTGEDVRAIAYPFGVWGADVDEAVAGAAARAGYQAGYLNVGSPERASALAIPRVLPGS